MTARRGIFAHPCVLLVSLCAFGCHTSSRVLNADGTPSRSIDPDGGDGGIGTGIETQDIRDAVYIAVSDILASPPIVQRPTPARLLIEDDTIELNTVRQFEKAFFIDEIRAGLVRQGAGRVIVVDRVLTDKRDVDGRPATNVAGFDLLLDGSINSLAAIDGSTQTREDSWQINFMLVKPHDSSWEAIWVSRPYYVRRRAQDSVIYR